MAAAKAMPYLFVLEVRQSLTTHQVTKTIPRIGNPEIKRYGKTAIRVDGSNIFMIFPLPLSMFIITLFRCCRWQKRL